MIQTFLYAVILFAALIVIFVSLFFLTCYALAKVNETIDKILMVMAQSPNNNYIKMPADITKKLSNYLIKEDKKMRQKPYQTLLTRTFRDFNILCWLPCGKISPYNLIDLNLEYHWLLIIECILLELIGISLYSLIHPYWLSNSATISQIFTKAFLQSTIVALVVQPVIFGYLLLANWLYLKAVNKAIVKGKETKKLYEARN